MTTPFFRWVGGKRQLLPQILPLLQSAMTSEATYYEPFLGGGAVFLALSPARAVLNDTNPHLTAAYSMAKHNPTMLVASLTTLCQRRTYESFMEARDAFNASDEPAPALFLYLNRLCFNGLHRVNKAGRYNSPYGKSGSSHSPDPSKTRCAPNRSTQHTKRFRPQRFLPGIGVKRFVTQARGM